MLCFAPPGHFPCFVGGPVCLPGRQSDRFVSRRSSGRGTRPKLPCRAAAVGGDGGGDESGGGSVFESDAVVIGSGIGGLGTAALLARSGMDVTVLESHTELGGAAHSFRRGRYVFDSGPSLYSGMSIRPSNNPLAHLLDAIGENPEWTTYQAMGVTLPNEETPITNGVGPDDIVNFLRRGRSSAEEEEEAVRQWSRLWKRIQTLAETALSIPAAAVRTDLFAAVTTFKYLPGFLPTLGSASSILRPFSEVLEQERITDPLLVNWMNVLCFLLSGLPADGTPTVEAVLIFSDFYTRGAVLDYPKGGSGALVDALVRGVTKHGGRVRTRSHVDAILVDGGNRAVGVKTATGDVYRAKKLVVSNLSCWDTVKLFPQGLQDAAGRAWLRELSETRECKSFMHLHLGFDAADLPTELLHIHYIHVEDWSRGVEHPDNIVAISIPSILDPSLAPPGKHVLHAYSPGTEPYDEWSGLERGSAAYTEKKRRRSALLWRAIEKVLPDIRSRLDVELAGTPLTHEFFLQRHRGSYGPGNRAGKESFPMPTESPVRNFLRCGDSVFPGIGLPAVAASAFLAGNSQLSVNGHLQLLKDINL